MAEQKYPKFTGRNVPIKEIAEATGLDAELIMEMIKDRDFEFGIALGGRENTHFYCSDKKVWEEIGYFKEVNNDEQKET